MKISKCIEKLTLLSSEYNSSYLSLSLMRYSYLNATRLQLRAIATCIACMRQINNPLPIALMTRLFSYWASGQDIFILLCISLIPDLATLCIRNLHSVAFYKQLHKQCICKNFCASAMWIVTIVQNMTRLCRILAHAQSICTPLSVTLSVTGKT